MKIICVTSPLSLNNDKSLDVGLNGDEVCYYLRPDTALLRNNESFYLPNSSNIKCQCALTVKINRLVKSLELRFVERCYSEVGLSFNFININELSPLKPWDLAVGFDKSFAVSPLFLPVREVLDIDMFEFEIADKKVSGECKAWFEDINSVISKVSYYMTLKIGDYISVSLHNTVFDIEANKQITGRLAGKKVISFGVK